MYASNLAVKGDLLPPNRHTATKLLTHGGEGGKSP